MPAAKESTSSYEQWLFRSFVNQMSSQHSNTALSWRKLYLSRAKLKASSRTSALLSGFAMVGIMLKIIAIMPQGGPCDLLQEEETSHFYVINIRTQTIFAWQKVLVLCLSAIGIVLPQIPVQQFVRVSIMIVLYIIHGREVALVEISIDEDKDVPPALLILFSICTTLLVSVHLLALMISTCILPHIEAVSNVHNVNAVKESPHEKMQVFIQMAWSFSTGVGIILFLAEITIICWLQFVSINKSAAIASTAIVVPVLVIFLIFAAFFYKRLISHKYEKSYQDLETLGQELAELQNHSVMDNLGGTNNTGLGGTYNVQNV